MNLWFLHALSAVDQLETDLMTREISYDLLEIDKIKADLQKNSDVIELAEHYFKRFVNEAKNPPLTFRSINHCICRAVLGRLHEDTTNTFFHALKHLLSCLKHLLSCLKHLLSCLKHLLSCLKHLLSCLKHLLSCLKHHIIIVEVLQRLILYHQIPRQ